MDGLSVEATGPVAVVRLDRPDDENRITTAMQVGLGLVWAELATDQHLRCLVLTGRGDWFCAGGNAAWLTSLFAHPDAAEQAVAQDQQIMRSMRDCPLPIIAAVNGPAVGLGCSIAMMSDLVMMADTAYLADPHVSRGITAGDGGAALLPFLMPFMRAKQFLFTGDHIPATLAERFGLAIEVAPQQHLLERAMALAHRIADQPAESVRLTKRAVNLHFEQSVAGVAQFASVAEALSIRTLITAAGRKRPPSDEDQQPSSP